MEEQKNFLIPTQRKLTEEEVKLLLDKYKLDSTSKLPRIKVKDPSISELEPQLGEVIEFKRNSFAGETSYYRVVVE